MCWLWHPLTYNKEEQNPSDWAREEENESPNTLVQLNSERRRWWWCCSIEYHLMETVNTNKWYSSLFECKLFPFRCVRIELHPLKIPNTLTMVADIWSACSCDGEDILQRNVECWLIDYATIYLEAQDNTPANNYVLRKRYSFGAESFLCDERRNSTRDRDYYGCFFYCYSFVSSLWEFPT